MARDPIGGAIEDLHRIEMQGISVAVPEGWEARIKLSAPLDGGQTFPVVHAATIPLPAQRGDYGSNVVERLGPLDIFISLIEFGPEAANTALFKPVLDVPGSPEPDEFHPRQLQRIIPGQGGVQRFFTYRGRAFCLYVVLGSFALRSSLLARVADLLGTLSIEGEG